MNQRVSDRHEGDLGGILLPFGDTKRCAVTVMISPQHASCPDVQHTAWMLLNLLSRFEGVLTEVGLCCPSGVQVARRLSPIAPKAADLRRNLLAAADEIGIVPVRPDFVTEHVIHVGPGTTNNAIVIMHVMGTGWSGGFSRMPITNAVTGISSLPFGPYVAACLAAGEIFKMARMREVRKEPSAFYSLWSHVASESLMREGPETVSVSLDAALAGVGAVGCACAHALWATSGCTGRIILADNDPLGLDFTNLNRYALFGRTSVQRAKATEAARLLADSPIVWKPHDLGIEMLADFPPRVVSAVDKNVARAGIQNRYPGRLFSGSTLDLRAETLRCGPPGIGACLRCFNPPERLVPDQDLRVTLQRASNDEIERIAREAGVSLIDAKIWAKTGQCGLAGERLLPLLRTEDAPRSFAVGFVSVMAGAMVAAELIKDTIGARCPLHENVQRAVFQFNTPMARTNRASSYKRDLLCPMCKPESEACRRWNQRYSDPGLGQRTG